MRTHTDNFKNEIKMIGKQINSKITYISGSEEIELGKNMLNSVSMSYDGNILKSVMKKLEIDVNQEIPLNTILNYQFGLKTRSGKNLFDKNNATIYSGYFNANGVIKGKGINTKTDKWIYIKCKPNTTYTVTKPIQTNQANNRFRIGTSTNIPNDEDTLNNFWRMSDGGTITTHTITTSNNANYLCVYYGKGLNNTDNIDEVLNGLQIELGDTATSYEAFGMYDWLDYGNFIVNKIEKQEDTNSYIITCYDKMLYSMVDYKGITLEYPITVRNYINAISSAIGLTFKNIEEEFCNYDKVINEDLFINQNVTFRDILDQLAEVTGSIICISNDDKLEIRYPSETNDTINESYLKDVNVKFGEKFGPVNSIVLSRSAESDNVYLQDEESLVQNGLCEIKIKDNQIMNFNDRDQFLPDLLETLDGLEFYMNDYSSTGICYYDIGDLYNINIDNNTYKCLMLNDDIEVKQGLEELIYTERPDKSETDYTKADKTDNRINQTTLIVNKQTGDIEALTNRVQTTEDTLNNTYTIEQVNTLVQNAIDGVTNQFTIKGGNNLLRNTGLWAKDETTKIPITRNLYNVNEPLSNTSYANTINCTFSGSELHINGAISYSSTGSSATILDYTDKSIIKLKAGKTYSFSTTRLSGSATRTGTYRTGLVFKDINSSLTWPPLSLDVEYDSSTDFTMSEDKELGIKIVIDGSSGGSDTFDNCVIGIQVEENTTYTDYVPYKEFNPYEYWDGYVERIRENNAVNSYALLLKNNTLKQQVNDLKNGIYTLSFYYKKLVPLSNPQCIINDITIDLDEEDYTLVERQIEVNARNIDLSFITDVDDSCIIYDLMLNSGEGKSEYSQNENETTTDTVNISKGITITSTETDVTFKANSTGIRTLDKYGNVKTEFTDIGMETSVAKITEEANIVGLLHRKVGNHVWVTKL